MLKRLAVSIVLLLITLGLTLGAVAAVNSEAAAAFFESAARLTQVYN